MFSRLRSDILERLCLRPGLAVRPVGNEGIPNVCDGKNARCERYLLPSKTARVTGPVPFLMMTVGYVERLVHV